ncbi:MAG: hypothetical protein IT257_06805 [Chitinophagaceae bacterium]|nr:hypothetical protein [Chitinophagaceae bacterium]
MENSNHNRDRQVSGKTAVKVSRNNNSSQQLHSLSGKKTGLQKPSGERLQKLFQHLAYQELDAD